MAHHHGCQGEADRDDRGGLVLVEIFLGHIVFRYFMGVNFFLVRAIGLFNSGDGARFKEVPFFHQLINAFRVRLLGPG